MKRKKFIKMLMWAGMSRNDAAGCAKLTQKAGRSYFRVLGDLLNFHRQDFGNPLAWLRMRYTIIHGYPVEPHRFYTKIDPVDAIIDAHALYARAVGMSAKLAPPAAYMVGIDLATAPDITAYKPDLRPDHVIINAEPVLDVTKKTATELADEIMEQLRRVPHD